MTEPEQTEQTMEPLSGISWSMMIVLVAVIVVADQVTKAFMTNWLGPDASSGRWELAGKYLAFEYIENRGAAFGILAGRTSLLIVLAVVVAIGFLGTIRGELAHNRLMQVTLALIAGGAIGNLIDRIRLGYVVDFVAVGSFPKFNIADSCITIAIVLLAWTTLFPPASEDAHAKDPSRE